MAAPSQAAQVSGTYQRPRLRAFLVAVPLCAALACLSVYADMVAKSVQIGVLQLAPPAIFALFALALFNKGLMRLTKREWLAPADLLIIYIMGLLSVLAATRGLIEKLIPPLAYLPYFARPENRYNELLTQQLPAWAMPFVPSASHGPVPDVIRAYCEGGNSVPWSAWVGPLSTWFSLWCCVILVFLSLATVLRRQWMNNEQLRFPLTPISLAMIRKDGGSGQLDGKGGPFWTSSLMWAGFGLGVGRLAAGRCRDNRHGLGSLYVGVVSFPPTGLCHCAHLEHERLLVPRALFLDSEKPCGPFRRNRGLAQTFALYAWPYRRRVRHDGVLDPDEHAAGLECSEIPQWAVVNE